LRAAAVNDEDDPRPALVASLTSVFGAYYRRTPKARRSPSNGLRGNEMSSSRVRRVSLVIVVNIAITLVLLAAAELVCRRLEQAGIDRDLPVRLRDIPPRSPGELRVFAFGGSTVFGVPVPEVGFVAQLQYWLERRYPDRDIRIYNYGYHASPLRLRAVLANAKYAMKTPFLNLDASRMYLLEAMQMGDHAWNVWANLATLSYLEGDDSRGATEMQRTRELHPEPFDLDDRALTPYLKEALEISAGHLDCGSP